MKEALHLHPRDALLLSPSGFVLEGEGIR